MVNIGLIQMSASPLNVQANLSKAAHYIAQTAKDGADLVVLPEMWPTSFPDADEPLEERVRETDEALARVAELSAELELVAARSGAEEVRLHLVPDETENTADAGGQAAAQAAGRRRVDQDSPRRRLQVRGAADVRLLPRRLRTRLFLSYVVVVAAGALANSRTPGMPNSRGRISLVTSCTVRSRSSQSTRDRNKKAALVDMAPERRL